MSFNNNVFSVDLCKTVVTPQKQVNDKEKLSLCDSSDDTENTTLNLQKILKQDLSKFSEKEVYEIKIKRNKKVRAQGQQEQDEELGEYDWYCICIDDTVTIRVTPQEICNLLTYFCQEERCDLECGLFHGCPYCIDEFYDDDIHFLQTRAQAEIQNEVTKEENTIFTDQRNTVVDEGYITTQTQPNLKDVSMQEDQWHVRDIMKKPIPFVHGDWSVSQNQGQIIGQWELPGDALLGPHFNQSATFVFWRGHPTVRFQINGTKFHSGRLIAAFIPVFSFGSYNDKLYDVDTLTTLPHIILDAGFSNSGVINLPFVHMNTYFNSVANRPWQSLGRLILVVFNKLSSATSSSQSIGYTGWISYDNCELHQPCYAHQVEFPTVGVKKLTQIFAQAGVEGLVKHALPLITDLVAPGASGLTNMIGDVIGGTSDMDKPTDPVEISRWVPNATTSLSMGTGLDKSSRLCLNNGSYTVGDADLVSTTRDDMDLLEISKIPTRLTTLSWTDSTSTGTILAKIPICPNVYTKKTDSSAVSPAVNVMTPTMLAYIARGFKFWRGGLRYKIQVIASQMHSGRLMIAFAPGVGDISFGNATYLNTYIIDLQERHEVEFTIPFLAERPWLRCDRMRQYLGVETETGDDNFENTGYLGLFVLNRLSKPDSVAASIDINVLVSASDDFELAVPADFTAFQGIGDVIPPTAQALVGQHDVTTRTEDGPITLTKGGGQLQSSATSTLSENAMNLKTLLRRYYKVYQNRTKSTGSKVFTLFFQNSPDLSGVNKCFNGGEGVQMRTHLAHFSQLYAFWRGSLRYKLIWNWKMNDSIGPITLKVFHIPSAFNFGNFSFTSQDSSSSAMLAACESYGTLLAQTWVQSSLEFEIPFYSPYTQLITTQGALPNCRFSTGGIVIVAETVETQESAVSFELYQAAGDDFTLNYLKAPPKIQFVDNSERQRVVEDSSEFLYDDIPVICPPGFAPTGSQIETPLNKNEEQGAQAQAFVDSIPVLGDHLRATKSIEKAGEALKNVCDTTGHLMQQASKKLGLGADDEEGDEETTIVGTITNTVSNISDPIISIFTTLNEYIQTLPTAFGLATNADFYSNIFDITTLISGFQSFMNGNALMKTISLISIITTLFKNITTIAKNKLYHFVTSILNNINGREQGNERPEAQSNLLDFVAPLTATISVAVGMLGFKSLPSDKDSLDIIKSVSEKLRLFNFSSLAFNNVKTLWIQLKDLFDWMIEKVVGLFNPTFLAQMKLHKEFEDVEEWARFLDDIENTQFEDRIHWDPEFKKKIYRAIDQGKKYNAYLVSGKFGREANVIREYVRKSLEIGTRCDNSKNGLPFRKDPFCVAMFGATGVGKSGIITEMAFRLMDVLGYPRHNRWCCVNCAEKFFTENYRQQYACYFDDFSTFTSEEQYQKFFNLKANTAFPLDMAFRKGEYFNSDFIFMTTNTSHPQPNCLTCIPALWRRRDALIEADFIDEVREAGARGEYVMREDNSHARYRLLDPRRENHTISPWMDFDQMTRTITEMARVHLERQNTKLTRDLTRAGYILPEAQSGEDRHLNVEACKLSPILMLYSPDIWQHIKFNTEMQLFYFDPEAPEEIRQDYDDMIASFTALGFEEDEFQKQMTRHSWTVKDNKSLISKIKGSLVDFKNLIFEKVKLIYNNLPALSQLTQWALKISVAFFALKAVFMFTGEIVHKCACVALRYFGYRCGLCGQWPKLANSTNPEWVLGEWKSLYGEKPYVDGHITSIDEEITINKIHAGDIKITGFWTGTKKKAQVGPYNDNTNGAKVLQVMAQNSPYNTQDKGQAPLKIIAHSTDKLATDLIYNRAMSSQYRIRFGGNDSFPAISMQAFAIGDRQIVTMAHFFQGINEGEIFEIFHSNAWMPIEYNTVNATALADKDLIVYNMPLQFHLHKSNIKHFISEKDLTYARKFPATLVKMTSNLITVANEVEVSPVESVNYVFNVLGVETPIMIQKAWKYALLTQPGDCGAILVAHNTKVSGKFLGFHAAGNGRHGWATLITREMLERFVATQNGSCIPEAEARLGNLIPQGHFGRIGKSSKLFFQNDKTDIVKTDIHGLINPPVTFPAVLSRNDSRLLKRVNPLSLGISKYSQTLKPFPLELRKIVNEHMRAELHTFKRLRRPTLLTDTETITGIPAFENAFEPLPMKTSPGWPYINTRPRGEVGKRYLFDINGSGLITDSLLQEKYIYREQEARKGERVESIWIDCMKDERRKLAKIQSGSTRIFTIGPVDFSMLCRKYTQDFTEALKASRSFSHCKLGIDCQSLEWTELYHYLSSFSDCMIAGDFSRFDGTVHAELIEDYYDDVDYFYKAFGDWNEGDRKVRKVLADETCNTIHLAKDEFYMTHGGNKSGNPATTPLNSRVNYRYMALAWLLLARRLRLTKYYTMASFAQNVRVACFGDDNILAVKKEVIEWYNQESISECLEEYGIIYTNESKTGVTKFKKLSECTFLKQGFAVVKKNLIV
uniref:Genome polyprotein n=1 Tax=Riboviria sp. TaxID=2585031 RepID=A0A6M9Z897_9VIRU|nr:MAG: polyprotein [Riboviria sp.]